MWSVRCISIYVPDVYKRQTAVSLSILLGRSTLSLEVKDNGRGFDAQHAQQVAVGFGLSSMKAVSYTHLLHLCAFA